MDGIEIRDANRWISVRKKVAEVLSLGKKVAEVLLHIITTPRGGIPRGVVLRIPPTFPNVTGDSVQI
jgi:hypothetical protein